MSLSALTLYQYKSLLHRLEIAGQLDFTGPTGSVRLSSTLPEYLKKEVQNPGTRKSYVSAILHVLKGRSEKERKPYTDMLSKLWSEIKKPQTLGGERHDEMLSWKDVLSLRNDAKDKLSPEEYLTYCLYTLNPPARADYAGMELSAKYTIGMRRDRTKNYCILGDKNAYFIFNVYKTATKHGQVRVDASPELFQVLRDTTQVSSGQLLSVQTPNALTKRVIRIFEKLSGKKMGIGLLRHSFITDYLAQPRPIQEKEIVARKMMHTWITQETYHIFD
jgi:hypothetical protein